MKSAVYMKRLIAASLMMLSVALYGQRTGNLPREQITLEECLDMARDNYPQIRELDLIERSRQYELAGISLGWVPRVSLSGKAGWQSEVVELPFEIPGYSFDIPHYQYSVAAEISQQIWDGGASHARKDIVKADAAVRKQVEDIESQIAMLEARIAALEESLVRGNSSVRAEVDTYLAQEKQLYDQLGKCRISSPIDGTVLTRYVSEGESVTVGKPVFKIADMSHMYVQAYFTTDQLSELKLGEKVTVIPDDGSGTPPEFEGTVTWISDRSEFTPKNIQTRNERADLVYAVRISLPAERAFRIGMYAYVVL